MCITVQKFSRHSCMWKCTLKKTLWFSLCLYESCGNTWFMHLPQYNILTERSSTALQVKRWIIQFRFVGLMLLTKACELIQLVIKFIFLPNNYCTCCRVMRKLLGDEVSFASLGFIPLTLRLWYWPGFLHSVVTSHYF